MSVSQLRRSIALVLILECLSGCGKSTSGPSGNTNCGTIVGNKGTVTAQVDGTSFSGIVPTGAATASQTTLTLFGQDTDNTTLTVAAGSVSVGTTSFGQGLATAGSILLQTRSCTTGTGLWAATAAGGSGTITITSISATAATGTFSGTLVAQAGSGASGTKVITKGAFTITF